MVEQFFIGQLGHGLPDGLAGGPEFIEGGNHGKHDAQGRGMRAGP